MWPKNVIAKITNRSWGAHDTLWSYVTIKASNCLDLMLIPTIYKAAWICFVLENQSMAVASLFKNSRRYRRTYFQHMAPELDQSCIVKCAPRKLSYAGTSTKIGPLLQMPVATVIFCFHVEVWIKYRVFSRMVLEELFEPPYLPFSEILRANFLGLYFYIILSLFIFLVNVPTVHHVDRNIPNNSCLCNILWR